MINLLDGAKGLRWASLSRLLRQSIQFVTIIILAQLLDPKDFGLMGIAIIVLNFLNTIRDFGLGSALIQKSDVNKNLVSTAFYLNLIASFLLLIATLYFAPIIASILSNEADSIEILVDIIRLLGVVFFITSAALIQQSMLEKELRFKNIAVYEISASLFGAIASIVYALNNGGVWSLVMQNIIVSIIIAISVIGLTGIPSIKLFDIKEIRKIYKFSLNLLGFNIVNYFVRNMDYILIGKFLGTTQLGYYSLAYRIMLYPIQNITNIVSRVMLPVYSKLKDDKPKFRALYKKISFLIISLTFPMMFGIMVLSTDFVELFIGDKWSMVGILLIFIAPIGALQSIATTSGSIYQALGRTDIMFKWGIFSSIAFTISFIIGLKWGILGVSIAYLIMNLLIVYPWLSIPFKLIELNILEFLISLKSIFIATIALVCFLIFINFVLSLEFATMTLFVFSTVVGILIYLITLYLIDKQQIRNLINQVKK
jgi:PST family polysaccharide transporter